MISTYPNFSPIDLKIKDEVMNFTAKFEPYADFSFINLFSWNTDEKAGVAFLNGNLVIKLPHYLEPGEYIYSILGTNDLDVSIKTLLQEAPQLDLVPEVVIKSMKMHDHLAIAEDRGSFDYVYSIEELVKMTGKDYKNKRNLINNTRDTLGTRLVSNTVNTLSDELKQEMLSVFRSWEKCSTQPINKVRLEYIAINRLLDCFEYFDLYVTLSRVDGKLNGFSIHEVVNKEYSLCHFEKSLNNKYVGAGAVLINEAAKFISDKSKLVNWEQDLGLPGLKKAKLAYKPAKYLRKYWIGLGSDVLYDF